MAIAFVTTTGGRSSGTPAIAAAASLAAVPSGALICVWVHSSTAVNVSSITDSSGNTYQQAGSYVNGVGRLSLWYSQGSSAGAPTITVTLASAADFYFIAAAYSGVATSASLHDTSSSTGTSTAPTTTSVTVNTAGDLVVALLGIEQPIAPPSPSSPFSSRGYLFAYTGPPASPTYVATGYVADDIAAPASEACSWTLPSSMTWGALGASFKAYVAPVPPSQALIYAPYAAGPPLRGMPWTVFIPRPANEMMAYPASEAPPPPTPPIPPVPPPPPNVPPPYPPLPPAPPLDQILSDLIDINKDLKQVDPRLRRITELLSIVLNSLMRTGQIIRDPVGATPLDFRIQAPTFGGLTGVYSQSGYYISELWLLNGLVQGVFYADPCDCPCNCPPSTSVQVPVDPFDPWDGGGAPTPTYAYPIMVTVIFDGIGGEAQQLNIVGSSSNIVPGTVIGATGLLGAGSAPAGTYNAPTGGTTAWGLYPGAYYVGFATSPTDDRFEMLIPSGTIENPDNPAWHDYVLINVNADGTVTTGVGVPTSGGFTVVVTVPP